MSVLIIGASVAGIRAATALRQRGYSDPITLLDADDAWPYDKPPLSKNALLPEGSVEAPVLLPREMAQDLNLEIVLGAEAVALDISARVVTVKDGRQFTYDDLIIASGAAPRTLPRAETLVGVHTIRNQADVLAIRQELEQDPTVVVIGAGFIGSEFASVSRERGLEVTIVEAQETPMAHLFGEVMGQEISSIHLQHGTKLVTGSAFSHFVGTDKVEAVVLENGQNIPADLVVIGIGVVPNISWLESSGLILGNGIPVDQNFRAKGQQNIYAIGDVSLRHHPLLGITSRIEHWTNAGEQAEEVAAILTDTSRNASQLPYVWSDQYGSRFQIIGRPSLGTLKLQLGTIADGSLIAIYVDENDQPNAAIAFNDNRGISRFRKNFRRGGSYEQLLTELQPAQQSN